MVQFVYYFLAGLLGASLASFAALCGDRLATNHSIVFPRSYCDNCFQALAPSELLPLFSYMSQKGQSRCCQTKLSNRYFITELIGSLGGLFIAHPLFGSLQQSLVFIALLYFGIAFYISDIFYFIFPEQIIRAFLMVILVLLVVFYPHNIFLHLITSTVIFIMLMGLDYVMPESIGGGDIKLLTILGLLLGPKLLLSTIFIASFLGIIIFLRMNFMKKPLTYIAFGPCIFIGALVSWLFTTF